MNEPGKKIIIAVLLGSLLSGLNLVHATDVSSTNFIIKDPIMAPGAGFGTSANYQLFGILGQPAIGSSTAGSFVLKGGFLYFVSPPFAPTGFSGTAVSESQINLAWTDSSNNEDGFQIERKTGVGGIYSQIATTTANIVSYSDAGLSASTTYFYRIRSYNGGGSSDYATEAGATTASGVVIPPVVVTDGGGGGGAPPSAQSNVIVSGYAYPKSMVTILINGVIAKTIQADSRAVFSSEFSADPGFKSFSVYASDLKGRRSLTYTFSFTLNSGMTSNISGIFISPTLDLDKSEVRKGDTLNILGQTAPSSTVVISINSDDEIVESISSGNDGVYLLPFDTNSLAYGDHSVKSRANLNDIFSVVSQLVSFKVGTRSIMRNLPGDLNFEGRVNIVDFSILLFWWNNTTAKGLGIADINKDSKIDLRDLSIMLFYWTG